MVVRPRFAHLALAALLALSAAPRRAGATERFGPLQISGNLQTQNLIRHPDIDTFQYVQNRNTARIRLEYKALERGKFYNRYDIPFIERADLFLLWRGVYDSIYDYTPDTLEKEDVHGRTYGGLGLFDFAKSIGKANALRLDSLGNKARNALKFDNQLREVYVDLKFRGVPVSVRAGRQQIVWGESDDFRMLDRVNPLDLTWHLAWEVPPPAFGWDDIRRPFWMFKFLYDLGDVWKFSQSFLEWYWNPGDWRPAKIDYMPRPWGVKILNPLTNPIDGGFIGGVCANSPIIQRPSGLPICTKLTHNTKLFQQGDYNRNPLENSQVGVRYHGVAPIGVEFTLNYLYQRWAGDDGTPFAPIRAIPRTFNDRVDQRVFSSFINKGIFPGEYITPYVHTVGVSANYSDEQYTQTVYRLETVYDVGIPFFDVAKVTLIDSPSVPGVTKKNMWKGMLGFDRPTWIRFINKKSTVLITGQWFWHHIPNYPDCQAQLVANLPPRQRGRVGECLVGGLDLPSSQRIAGVSYRDKVREWESLFSLGAVSFFRGGSIIPIVGFVVDPVNQFNMNAFWTADYTLRHDLVVNLAQRYFITPRGRSTPIFDGWGLGSMSARRSETSIRITYQF